MRIYNKKDFLKLPDGTFFAKGIQWSMDGFCIKGNSLENDFYYLNLVNIDFFNSKELSDRYEEMLSHGSSYPINQNEGRDGMFDDEDIFLVFEIEDLEKIKELIDKFISGHP
jgi:hypothetical protein